MLKLLSYWKDESGAAAAEYALILGVVGAVIAAALVTLQTDIIAAINKVATAL